MTRNNNMMTEQNSSRLWLVGTISSVVILGSVVWWRWRTDKNVLQRRFWDVIYDRGAVLYDSVDWLTGNTTHRLRRRALDHLLLPKKNNCCPRHYYRVLEIGMGTGRLHVDLAVAGHYGMAGLDLAPGMVRLTARRLAARGLTSDLHIGDVTSAIPWKNDTFDVVLSTFCLSAIQDAETAIAEMVRVLKSHGKLIIVDAGEAQNGNFVAKFLAWLWSVLGDYMRDDATLLAAHEDMIHVIRHDYGPWDCVHITVGEKK